MSLEQITAVTENFISNTHNDLLVIRGKWGAGKTFFWQRLIEESRGKKCVGRDYYSYVSLFGVTSLEELKNAILVSTVESDADNSKQKLQTVTASLRKLTTSLEGVPALREYTGGMVSAFLHHFVDNTLICFDDIERKGDGLSIKDIFGLASVLKEQRNCKVLLIMNDESLRSEEHEQLKVHGEKIIDREIQFSITPEESFGYVFQPSVRHYELIKNCCFTLHIKNIRILQRVKRFVEDITPHLDGSEVKVAEALLRSLILYVWCYYDKESSAPPLDFVLDYSPVNNYLDSKNKIEVSPDAKKWNEIINSYGYFITGDVDRCLADFVKTGFIDKPKFSHQLNEKNEQVRVQQVQNSFSEVWEIYRNSFDDNEQEFVDKLVDNFRSNIRIMPFNSLQSALAALREFGRDALANNLVDEYLSQRTSEEDIKAIRHLEHSHFLNESEDEYLLSRLRDIWASNGIRLSLAETLMELTFKEGWNLEYARHLDSFTVDDYYEFFKADRSKNLPHYVRKCLECRETGSEPYKSVGEKAKEALLKLASECRINRMRVSTLYKIDVG